MPRTRSESAHKKVVHAALELVAERGVDATSMDAIAAKSGVSKATIYKHWADKDTLLLEMMAAIHGLDSRPTFDSGDVRADMAAVLSYQPKKDARMREQILPHFVAYSARNVEFGNAWRNMVMEPPRRELKHLIRQGIAKGELASGLDMDLCLALLLGPVLYWHIFLRRTTGDRRVLAEGVVDVFWRAFGRERTVRQSTAESAAVRKPKPGRRLALDLNPRAGTQAGQIVASTSKSVSRVIRPSDGT